MSVTDPRNLSEHYNELFRKGDLEGWVCLYEEDATLCPAPGEEIRGRAEIRKRLSGLIALKGDLSTPEQRTSLYCTLAGISSAPPMMESLSEWAGPLQSSRGGDQMECGAMYSTCQSAASKQKRSVAAHRRL